MGGGPADERWASLCNCVVNFLLEERYHLTALELLQELQEDGRSAHALRLRAFFSDPALFPPDLVARGDSVAIVFETPGVSLSLRGIANESGRLGASVSVTNAASKKVLQAVVIAPGRVSVGPISQPQPILQASAAP